MMFKTIGVLAIEGCLASLVMTVGYNFVLAVLFTAQVPCVR